MQFALINPPADLDAFTLGYVETLFFANEGAVYDDESNELYGFPNDASKLAPSTLATIKAECAAFQALPGVADAIANSERDAGRDFYFSRNRHGCGFWDGNWNSQGDWLDNLAKSFGEVDHCVGDDGLIY